jgi:hypothetical protein
LRLSRVGVRRQREHLLRRVQLAAGQQRANELARFVRHGGGQRAAAIRVFFAAEQGQDHFPLPVRLQGHQGLALDRLGAGVAKLLDERQHLGRRFGANAEPQLIDERTGPRANFRVGALQCRT